MNNRDTLKELICWYRAVTAKEMLAATQTPEYAEIEKKIRDSYITFHDSFGYKVMKRLIGFGCVEHCMMCRSAKEMNTIENADEPEFFDKDYSCGLCVLEEVCAVEDSYYLVRAANNAEELLAAIQYRVIDLLKTYCG